MPLLKKILRPQKGQILVLTVILLPLFLITFILIVEVGFFYIKQTQLQSAADAIALAGMSDENEADAKKLIKLNRTVDFKEVDYIDFPVAEGDDDNVHRAVLKESVIPIFVKIFGTGAITTITVCSKAEDGKLVPWDL